LRILDLLRSEICNAVEASRIFVLPFARDFEVVTTSITSHLLHTFDDVRTVTPVPSVFVDVAIDDAKIVRVLPRGMVALAEFILHELGEYLGYSPPPLLERLIGDAQKIHQQRPILQKTLATATQPRCES